MFGLSYIKTQPTTHLMQFRGGQVVREGAGLSFFYYAPNSTLIAIPLGSAESNFTLELVTNDFQAVTVQGHASFRVVDPKRIASMMDYSLKPNGRDYNSEDPQKLHERVAMQAVIIVKEAIQALDLKQALKASASIARDAQRQLSAQSEVLALGLEILGLTVIAIKPTPDIARALEAEARESNLKIADDAIYLRRMAAVQNERAIRQNELDTEVAVELKKREIQETQWETRAAVVRSQNELRSEQMDSDIKLEQERKSLVDGQTENTRKLAEAEAHKVSTLMLALGQTDPRVVQALTASGMQPSQLIAQAFGGIAEKAERIGQFNMSPDLLQSLMASSTQTGQRVNTGAK